MAVLLASLASLPFIPTYVARGMVLHPFLLLGIAIVNIAREAAVRLSAQRVYATRCGSELRRPAFAEGPVCRTIDV